jgi:hypothetical protein
MIGGAVTPVTLLTSPHLRRHVSDGPDWPACRPPIDVSPELPT